MMRHFYNAMLRVKRFFLFSNTKSITLNGTSQYMSVADDDSLSFTDGAGNDEPFSISFWANLADLNSVGFIGKHDGASAVEYRFFTNASGYLSFLLVDSGSDYIGRRYASAIPGRQDIWAHYSVTYDGSNTEAGIKIYVDAIRADDTSLSSGTYNGMPNSTAPLEIGKSNTFYADGKFDQVALWDKELSIEEIKEAMVLRDLTQHSAYANIVSWWEFDDADVTGTTVSDRVGSNDGTMVATPTRTTCVPFPYSYQLNADTSFENVTPFTDGSTATLTPFGGFSWDFDGVDEYISVPDSNDLSFGDGSTDSPFSLSAWVNMNDATTFRIIAKAAAVTREYLFGFNATDKIFFYLYDNDSSVRIGRQTSVAYTSLENEWVFVTATYSGNSSETGISIYINGVQVDDTTSNALTYTAMHNTPRPLLIGSYEGTPDYADGKIDQPTIWDKELSAVEVAEVYNNHEPRDETKESLSGNIAGYWRGYNSTNVSSGVLDQSGNANHGTMTNMEDADIVYDHPREAFDLANGNEGSFDFDGVDEYVTVPDDDSLSFTDGAGNDEALSISAWVNMDSAIYFPILAKNDGTNKEWEIYTGGSADLFFLIRSSSTGKYVGRKSDVSDDLVKYQNEWIHVVGTYDGSGNTTGIKMYINGSRVDVAIAASHPHTGMENTSAPVEIGRRDATSYANGSICHTSIIGKELSQCEVQELYNDGSPVDI
ncbi:LamG domain-containing protein, partial [Gammaproteobacteria bacterium]|nr:LamG domain-containing protein [Gammaproteobacteria bacterium]